MAREDSRLDSVRSECYKLIKDISLTDIVGKDHFKNLERDNVANVLVERVKTLESPVKVVFLQLIGLEEFCLVLCLKSKNHSVIFPRCPEHFDNDHIAAEELSTRVKTCTTCKRMIEQLIAKSKRRGRSASSSPELGGWTASGSTSPEGSRHLYGGSHHFDSKLVSILQDLHKACEVIASTKQRLGGVFIAGASPKF